MAGDCGLGVGTLVIIDRVRWRERLTFLHLRFDLGEEFYHRDASGGKAPCSGSRAPRVVESRRPATRRERVAAQVAALGVRDDFNYNIGRFAKLPEEI